MPIWHGVVPIKQILKVKFYKKHLKQKHAIRLICNENKFTHTRRIMRSLLVQNVFQVNIQKILVLNHCVKLEVMYQVFSQIYLPTLPIDSNQISWKATSHYLYIYIINQNIKYIFKVLHFRIRFGQTLRKNFKRFFI